MSSDLARQSHALFVRALDIEAPRRDQFVRESCAGDAALEARVRRLLAALDRSTGFLEEPALGTRHPGAASRAIVAPDAIRVPGYHATKILGVGGMATVYEAVQRQPERTVALKVMNRGLESPSAVRRFKYETEVLGRLHHPGIAQIFEAGTCDDGSGRSLPFFAMELVQDARTLTDHAREHSLTLRQRLELFASVCDAVQHGHQFGVIHRDLKPANILVDSAGRAKIIDFGIARPVDTERADITRRADIGHMIGTLNFMSPEQCRGSASVDVRTDVYSLGVILYQLVADRLPHDLGSVSVPEAVRIIADDYPRALGAVVPAARGDLEAIAAMAMEKEPARRYSGAGALATDVRRYLRYEPIEARPATTVYQIRKFARRHRPLVAAIGASFATLLIGVVVSARLAYVARVTKDAAEQRQAELEQVAEFQESQLSGIDVRAMGERLHASLLDRARQGRARQGIDPAAIELDLAELEQLIADVNFTSLALSTLDESVLRRSQQAIDSQFAEQPLLRARLLQTLASTMHKLGLISRAEPLLVEALRIRRKELPKDDPDTLLTVHALGSLLTNLGRYDEGYGYLKEAYEGRTRVLGPEHRATLATGTSLGGVLRKRGDLDEAERIWELTLRTQRRVLGDDNRSTLHSLNNMGVIHAVRGRFTEAERYWRELLERRGRTVGEDDPDYQTTLSNLSAALQEQGKLTEARPLVEQSLALARKRFGDDHSDTLFAMSTLGALLIDLGEWSDAEGVLRECLQRRERRLGPDHPDTLVANAALATMFYEKNIVGCATEAETAEAERRLRATLAAQRRDLGDQHVETLESVATLVGLLCDTGVVIEAERLSRDGIELSRVAHPSGHWTLGRFLTLHGRALSGLKRWTEAETALLEGHAILKDTRGEADRQTQRAVRALVAFYDERHRAQPGAGHDASAARWRGAVNAASTPIDRP